MKIFGILNLTPDSFSDGGLNPSASDALKLIDDGAFAVDVGAESTRPGATAITLHEEWQRLKPLIDSSADIPLSIDTRNYETAKKVLNYNNVKYLNDVTGFNDSRMVQLAAESGINIIVMHSLTVPADKEIILTSPVIPALKNWISAKFQTLTEQGIKANKIIFDPGIGFGKSAAQSREIVHSAAELAEHSHSLGTKILYGHSRKSFLGEFADKAINQRDKETALVTSYLQTQNVDYIRVHNVEINQKALTQEALY